MGLLQISAVVVSLAALLAFFNYRVVGLPTTIGVMLLSLIVSAALVAADLACAWRRRRSACSCRISLTERRG